MQKSNPDPQVQHYPEDEDFEKFIASLPREEGWGTPFLNKFQGFWLPPLAIQRIIACQNHFQAQDSDIFLSTFPKCGTTWLKALIFTLINRKKHSPLSQEHPLVTNNPHALVPYFSSEKTPDFSSYTTPRFFATHTPVALLPKSVIETKCKLVYICRDPKDTFVSYLYFSPKTDIGNDAGSSSLDEAVNMFCKGLNLCEPYWDHVLDCWKTSLEKPDKILFLTYEELKSDPVSLVRRLADFLGYGFSPEEEDTRMVDAIVEMCSFEYLSTLEVNSSGSKKLRTGVENKELFRKGEVGDWRNHLTVEMADQIDSVTEQKFQGSGLLEQKPATFSKSVREV